MTTTNDVSSAETRAPLFGDQRPPWLSARNRPRVPRHAMRKARTAAMNASLVRALGWLSIGLGAVALLAPRSVSQSVGSKGNALIARLCGARELACGIGLLNGRHPEAWLYARVAGDVIDLGLLGSILANPRSDRARTVAATAAVLGVTVADVFAARRVRELGVRDNGVEERSIDVEKTLFVNRLPQVCYELWRNVENLPRFMKHVVSVTATGPGRTHWVATAPVGTRVEWDAEITNDQPGRLIAWRSLDESDVDHAGVVRFDPDPAGRGTIVRVEMHYTPPAGRFGAVAKLFGDEPSQSIQEDLRRFKRLLETGEIPTTEGQSHGTRGTLYRLLRRGHQR